LLAGAARSRLRGREQAVCLALLSLARATRTVRNSYAHAIWGYSNDLPEKILRIDSNDLLGVTGDFVGRVSRLRPGERVGLPGGKVARNRVLVFSERDMQRDSQRTTRVSRGVHVFLAIRDARLFGLAAVWGKHRRARVLRMLSLSPDLQEEILRPRKDRHQKPKRSHGRSRQ
jgi:hypothetical protein